LAGDILTHFHLHNLLYELKCPIIDSGQHSASNHLFILSIYTVWGRLHWQACGIGSGDVRFYIPHFGVSLRLGAELLFILRVFSSFLVCNLVLDSLDEPDAYGVIVMNDTSLTHTLLN
jgi:hypothetical protein